MSLSLVASAIVEELANTWLFTDVEGIEVGNIDLLNEVDRGAKNILAAPRL